MQVAADHRDFGSHVCATVTRTGTTMMRRQEVNIAKLYRDSRHIANNARRFMLARHRRNVGVMFCYFGSSSTEAPSTPTLRRSPITLRAGP